MARAFAARPTLLLCDEITSALDVSVQATILELIAELTTTFGTTVIFVSHDLAVVRTICRHAVVLRDGKICEEGLTKAATHRTRSPQLRRWAGLPTPVGYHLCSTLNTVWHSVWAVSLERQPRPCRRLFGLWCKIGLPAGWIQRRDGREKHSRHGLTSEVPEMIGEVRAAVCG